MKLTTDQLVMIGVCAAGILLLAWVWCRCHRSMKESYSSCTTQAPHEDPANRECPSSKPPMREVDSASAKQQPAAHDRSDLYADNVFGETDLGNDQIRVGITHSARHETHVEGWQIGRLNPAELERDDRWSGVM